MAKVRLRNIHFLFFFCLPSIIYAQLKSGAGTIHINDEGYYEAPGINFMMFDDFYPEGHQGGLTVIQRGTRIAANGDIRLEPSPGQWAPVPKMGGKQVDKEEGIISIDLWYPDPDKNQKGFNPIQYPDLKLKYTIRTESMGKSIKLIVDLEKPLPKKYENKIPSQHFLSRLGWHHFCVLSYLRRVRIVKSLVWGGIRLNEDWMDQKFPFCIDLAF